MTTRIGLISDVHSSPDALADALNIFDRQGVDEIICGGDIAGYYELLLPTIRMLAAANCRTIIGNHDQYWLEKYAESGDPEIRDYSVYSGNEKDYLEVLVRRVEDGLVSKQLCDLDLGDEVSVGGPYGHFKLTEEALTKPLLLISTGTGISPFHSYAESHEGLNFRLIHGTARADENYESEFYGENYFHCVSREEGGDFKGRVTDYLKDLDFDSETNAFLCGNCDMIYEAFDMLQDKGLPTGQIHTEVYF